MRRVIVGVVILALVLALAGTAVAKFELTDEVSLGGKIRFQIGSPDVELISKAYAIDVYVYLADFEGMLGSDEHVTLSYVGSEVATLKLDSKLSKGLYDMGSLVPSRVGLKVSTDYLTFYVNNGMVDSELKYNFGAELSYELDSTTLGLLVLNTGETDITGYAVQIEAGLDPVTLTAQYGMKGDDLSAYFAKIEYPLDKITLSASYLMSFEEISEIVGELCYAIADKVTGKINLTKAEDVDLTYYGRVEIGF